MDAGDHKAGCGFQPVYGQDFKRVVRKWRITDAPSEERVRGELGMLLPSDLESSQVLVITGRMGAGKIRAISAGKSANMIEGVFLAALVGKEDHV